MCELFAASLTGPERVALEQVDDPVPGAEQVLIKVAAAGICRTDVRMFRGSLVSEYPRISGHEFSGTVAAIGDRVRRFSPGDRVTADPNLACGYCEFCQRNEPNQCLNHEAIGISLDGGFASYVLAPQSNVFPIGGIPFAAAALVEPLACVVWGLKRVDVQPGDSVLIFGAGAVGCLLAMALRNSGAGRVAVTDTVRWRIDRALEIGATDAVLADDHQDARLRAIAPLGFDVVVEATGLAPVLEQAMRYARPRGRVWVFGVASPDARSAISPHDVFRKDLSIIGSHAVNKTFPEAIAWVESGAVPVERLISHTFPLNDYREAITLAGEGRECLKVQFEID